MEYEVESILKVFPFTNTVKVLWKEGGITYEPIFNLTNCREKLEEYLDSLLTSDEKNKEKGKEIMKIIWFLERKKINKQ